MVRIEIGKRALWINLPVVKRRFQELPVVTAVTGKGVDRPLAY